MADHSSEVSVKHGAIGQHFDAVFQIAPEKLEYWGHSMLLASPILYGISSTLPKLVILAVYLRIFVQKWVRIGCHTIGATLLAAWIINLILFLCQCSPMDYVWNKTISHGYCRDNIQAHIRWGQLPNIVTDIAMLILPLVRSIRDPYLVGVVSGAVYVSYELDSFTGGVHAPSISRIA